MKTAILLVDDNPTFMKAVRQFIETIPGACVVGTASDGEQALKLAVELEPDIMILDIVMPRRNGLDVAREMQHWPKAPQILMLTAHDSAPYKAAARELGAAALVVKSDFVNALMPLLERLIAERAQVCASTHANDAATGNPTQPTSPGLPEDPS